MSGLACKPFSGLRENIKRRSRFYTSDYWDGVRDSKSIHKTVATTLYIYFTTILPCIAFGMVNSENTNGKIDARRAITGQAIGGLIFALVCGQPLVMIATTAPATLFTKVIYDMSYSLGVDFWAFFACVGIFNAIFCTLFSIFNVCYLFKWCTRSIEEIFASFSVFISFIVYAVRDCIKNIEENYSKTEWDAEPEVISNSTLNKAEHDAWMKGWVTPAPGHFRRERTLLFIILMMGTFVFSRYLYNFKRTKFFNRSIREVFADYALTSGVILFSALGSFTFGDIEVDRFNINDGATFKMADLSLLNTRAVLMAIPLGFLLAVLFFMDQNITAGYVNRPENKLKKGTGYHLDILASGLISAFTAMFGFPFMFGILPHSYLQLLALADVQEIEEHGITKKEIVYVRETRLPVIFSQILIGLSLLAVPYPLKYIPVPVLDGLFLFCAIGMLQGHNLSERLFLIITEKRYHPRELLGISRRSMNAFTFCQLVQVALLSYIGFSGNPYLKMAFPLIVALYIPIRHLVVPLLVDCDALDRLDPVYEYHERESEAYRQRHNYLTPLCSGARH